MHRSFECHHYHERHDLLAQLMAGRRRGGFFGDDDDLPGGRRHRRGGGRPGRMFGQGDLKLLLLSLIEAQPRHGYELIRAIEDLCGGSYTPSPGAIYPSLTYLEEAGYATVQEPDQSNKKKYAITEEGRRFLEQNRVELEAVVQQLKLSSRMMARLAIPEPVHAGLHHLRATLIGHDRPWDSDEIARVRAILERASQDVADGGTPD